MQRWLPPGWVRLMRRSYLALVYFGVRPATVLELLKLLELLHATLRYAMFHYVTLSIVNWPGKTIACTAHVSSYIQIHKPYSNWQRDSRLHFAYVCMSAWVCVYVCACLYMYLFIVRPNQHQQSRVANISCHFVVSAKCCVASAVVEKQLLPLFVCLFAFCARLVPPLVARARFALMQNSLAHGAANNIANWSVLGKLCCMQ